MKRMFAKSVVAALVCIAMSGPALAHAFLDHAVPGVGTTVGAAPPELALTFTEDIVPAFSGVRVTNANGAAVALGRPRFGPANTMHVRPGRALGPGTYIVSWHVVSVDTHHTQGAFKFTIGP
jgi:methionine-rich copper-binding protein CopC